MVSRCHELKVVNTVCPVTIRRQEDTLEAAREVDLMVVVGGSKSANTKELTRLCEINGTRALQIESAKELIDAAQFSGVKRVGVTGGTSTPIEDLEVVVRTIVQLAGTEGMKVKAAEIAHEALAAAATPQYRTTSLSTSDAR
jgi:4-hydroxy-3-methylbut-2-enyl diphosphate reductase